MEKRKKGELPHWVMPGVFSGPVVAEEAVERMNPAKRMEITVAIPATGDRKEELEDLTRQLQKLEAELEELKEALSGWVKRVEEMERDQAKERQHLYQVVLALKKEWERNRDEHRHH